MKKTSKDVSSKGGISLIKNEDRVKGENDEGIGGGGL